MSKKRARPNVTVSVTLTREQVDDLVRLASYYQRSMGVMRHVVRLTSPGPIRRRFRFVAEESRYLQAFAEAVRAEMTNDSDPTELTPRSLVAFWGRALSSLNSKRSRRRMSAEEIGRREALADTLRRSTERLWLNEPALVESEIATRRAPEAAWMREQLSLPAETSG
jgi:hypothetical protein